jgi:predicted nucleotidyltransferase
VVTRAVRDLVSTGGSGRPAAAFEVTTGPYADRQAFEEAARSRLERDLALSPEERVRVSEDLARTGVEGRGRGWLADACARLNAHGARYVLVGGFAVQLWGEARATRDIDILIEPTVENAERVLRALSEGGGWLAHSLTPEDLLRKPVTVVGDLPRIDIMTVAWQVRYPEIAAAARVFEVEGVRIPTASIEHLIASKRTGRARDAADIEVLEAIRSRLGERRR